MLKEWEEKGIIRTYANRSKEEGIIKCTPIAASKEDDDDEEVV